MGEPRPPRRDDRIELRHAYCRCAPRFRKATLHLENGRTLTIDAPANSKTNLYVQGVSLNGKPIERTFVTHEELMAGGVLHFDMGPTPNRHWATGPGAAPYSMTPRK